MSEWRHAHAGVSQRVPVRVTVGMGEARPGELGQADGGACSAAHQEEWWATAWPMKGKALGGPTCLVWRGSERAC
jgi:hypothetical protein